tara:strand:- start:6744 stop:6944 length:201 start_codon:yes stop_codon:yes gene_type:complete
MNILQKGSVEQLEALKYYIENSDDFDTNTKEQLIETLSDRIRFLNLEEIMKPVVKEFIKERKEKGL